MCVMRAVSMAIAHAVAMLAALLAVVNAAPTLRCDLSGDATRPGITTAIDGDVLDVEWEGASNERLRLRLGIVDKAPVINQLAIRSAQSDWITVLTDARFEFKIVEGLRRITNQQLAPLRSLGVELTQEIVDRHKWDAFWDAPLDLLGSVPGNNPPPSRVVAGQPGLPRSADEIRRSDVVYDVS